eukprot:TRINITY_DN44454_c0_g2_i1.p1 TRINITY_DN44454_c0_g2~~TRINITY_DN44454_c0_g2_i1.p1  ORF type:complete len:199 (+),score=30.48 TRINITY_DN44454_c0_g2_i1:186-782(+)
MLARLKREHEERKRLAVVQASKGAPTPPRRERRLLSLLDRPIHRKVPASRSRALCVCGAQGTGPKQLTGISEDMATAADAFGTAGVSQDPQVWLDASGCNKQGLLFAVSQLAQTRDVDVCFIYFTGHAKRPPARAGSEERTEAEQRFAEKYASAWVLSKASIEEFETMTDRDLLSPSCLLYTSPSPRDRTRSRMPSSA